VATRPKWPKSLSGFSAWLRPLRQYLQLKKVTDLLALAYLCHHCGGESAGMEQWPCTALFGNSGRKRPKVAFRPGLGLNDNTSNRKKFHNI